MHRENRGRRLSAGEISATAEMRKSCATARHPVAGEVPPKAGRDAVRSLEDGQVPQLASRRSRGWGLHKPKSNFCFTFFDAAFIKAENIYNIL